MPDYKHLTATKAPAGDTSYNSQPTAQEVFGPDPWVKNPTGAETTTGQTYPFNPYYFATPEAAQIVADMVGGTVFESVITRFGPFTQSHPNQMVQLPSGKVINAGLFMSFWDNGYSQAYIDLLVKSELEG